MKVDDWRLTHVSYLLDLGFVVDNSRTSDAILVLEHPTANNNRYADMLTHFKRQGFKNTDKAYFRYRNISKHQNLYGSNKQMVQVGEYYGRCSITFMESFS